MQSPKLNGKNVMVLIKKKYFSTPAGVDLRSRFVLYFSKILLFAGMLIILLENFGYISGWKKSYFGLYDWETATVFLFGIFLSFVSVPYLYFSSFEKYKKHDDFWDQEMFWILPLFFFATFFQYGSGIFFMLVSLAMSVLITLAIHVRFMYLAGRMARGAEDLEKHQQYYDNLKYLTVYYLILFGLYFFVDPIQILRGWMSF